MTPVYDFGQPRNSQVPDGVIPPQIPNHPNLNKNPSMMEDPINKNVSEEIRSTVQAGFYYQDKSIKSYFDDLMIPTLDGAKKVDVRLAGGDRTILVWKQDLDSGRIKLPVVSINRTSISRDEGRFSPPYVPIYSRFQDRDGTRMIRQFREWSCTIEYQLSLWAEKKRDLEYIIYMIITRFNPLAEWVVDDEQLSGRVQAKLNGVTISSDIDAGADKQAYQRADINVSVLGWLPLPTYIITPTVLGKVASINEDDGTILGSTLDVISSEPGNM